MNRRKFIKQTGVASAVLGFSGHYLINGISAKKSSDKHITILHTNDVHSHLEAFPASHSKFPNRGGASKRKFYFDQVRNENTNTLILDAGDSFQGTPYFNFYGGELEFKTMSKLGYHATTIGNHEFDNGVDNIAAQLEHANFDLISSNYDVKNTLLDGLVQPHQIYEVDEVKIGVFGLGIELNGLVSKDLYKETKYLNPIEVAQDQVRLLRNEENCDLVICLSHLGYSYENEKIDDLKLAKKTAGIDLIIGGHTHTFLDEPTQVENSEGQKVLVNQVGWAGLNVGRIDFYLNKSEVTSTSKASLLNL
ncbi:MAG: metallophosphatase [Flavobacteriaceae bacterium]|nr:metallophosphatase [Flavobacteriaceae bacterium]